MSMQLDCCHSAHPVEAIVQFLSHEMVLTPYSIVLSLHNRQHLKTKRVQGNIMEDFMLRYNMSLNNSYSLYAYLPIYLVDNLSI